MVFDMLNDAGCFSFAGGGVVEKGDCWCWMVDLINLKSKIRKVKSKKSPDQKVRASINMAATYSPALWCSTIGHEGLNYSVRNGKR